MFESLLKSMSSILGDLNKENVESEYSVDVTTDEGIKKVRDSVYNLKGNIKSLREKMKDSWLSFVWDKDTLDSIDTSLDEVLEDAEKKYREARGDGDKPKEEKSNKSSYVRPVLLLNSKDASKAYEVVDKYLETQICPRLSKSTTQEYISSIKESLVDFAAWLVTNKY